MTDLPVAGGANRWLMLAVGMLAQAAGTVAASTAVFLIPYLHLERGLSLPQAGALASASLIGTTLTLVPWGFVVDRVGERFTLTTGLLATGLATVGAAFTSGYVGLAVCWFLAGAGLGSSNAASGRLVVGWFPAHRRGFAMGIRQTALPLGMGFAAVFVPSVVAATDLRTTLLAVAAICGVACAACAALVVDPPRAARHEAPVTELANPYRGSTTLLRIHAASALLVVPQFTVWTFMLVWLIDTRSWAAGVAGALVAAAQVLGAAGRIGVGWWSDRVASRLGPLRLVAMAAAVTMLLLGLVEPTPAAIAVIVLASVVTVADNGLAFTAVAELSGPFWSGRALGLQNTGQYFVSALVPPAIGALIDQVGYAWAFGLVAVLPAIAVWTVPREHVAT